jgi:hypothetical protein
VFKENSGMMILVPFVLSRDEVAIDWVWLVIGFIGHFHTARDYTITHTLTSTVTSPLVVTW